MPSNHPVAFWNRLTGTYWFVPSLVTLVALALGTSATFVDRWYPDSTQWLGWAYGGGADGARSLLSAIAGSTITVVSVTFSVLVVALTVSSQHFGPRLLNSFMRDRTAQLVLGTFTGLFVYCLVVLRTVQGDGGDRYAVFVPHLAVTGAVGLALFSVGMLIYYVHHVARSMQVSEITFRVANDLEASIRRLYPEPLGERAEPPESPPPPTPPGATIVLAPWSGYVQEIDTEALLATGSESDVSIWLIRRPGDFVVEGMPVAAADPAPPDPGRLCRLIREAFVIGTDRTTAQDAGFAVQQLVEVSLRALSPGVNEPFTALTCIDRLTQGLTVLAGRRLPAAVRRGPGGRVRVIAEPRTFVELLVGAFEPVLLAAQATPPVIQRVIESLTLLASLVTRDEDRAAIAQLGDLAASLARGIRHDAARARIDEGCHALQRALDRSSRRSSGHLFSGARRSDA